MTQTQALFSIMIIAAVTFLTRAAPFIMFPKRIPKYVEYLGGVIPFAVMGMLIIYCLKAVRVTKYPYGLPEGIAILFVVLVHKWKHNLLLSIGGGTVLYMFLIQKIF